jgi:cysteine-rich repeat protein
MAHHRIRSLGPCVCLAALVGACFDPPGDPTFDPTFAGPATSDVPDPTTTATSSDGGSGVDPTAGGSDDTAGDATDTAPPADGSTGSTGPAGPVCGNGMLEDGEECDDGNAVDTDACPSTCIPASCGDGFVLAGMEACDDGNALDDDACVGTCVAASCGDGLVYAGMEGCDDGNAEDTDDCLPTCVPASCGDGAVHAGLEQCDDGNGVGNDGCSATCLAECGNPGGGSEVAENGTSMGVMYCYNPGDSTEVRANKACESHFGVGACCLIPGGYSGLQYGQCGADGGAGTYHWHPDFHPDGHCGPFYVPGDVVAPGWCGVILGSFLD